ncbi:hypothetical protein AB0K74_12145 [Streptomyces sp. NPDC056159]|uniref:hypothetical protein n=1 Tax=Streptomyces sp. NPDC056159 TaxID=3155537 RepID=UPI00343FE00C
MRRREAGLAGPGRAAVPSVPRPDHLRHDGRRGTPADRPPAPNGAPGHPPAPPTPRSSLPPCGFLAHAVRPGPPSDAGTDPPAARTHTLPARHWTEEAGNIAAAAGLAHTAHAVGPAHAADRLADQRRRPAEASRHHARHRVHGTG